jgi:ubiquinone/menaquinone biosynthesis C-methylase UbiE
MEGDFAKLGEHQMHKQVLIKFLQYRISKAQRTQIVDIIERCVKKKLSSAAALDELSDIESSGDVVMTRGSIATDTTDYETNRVAARIRDLNDLPRDLTNTKLTTYLDIGCGNGVITRGLGKHLGLDESHIFGADIANWAGHTHEKEVLPGFIFKTIDIGADTYHIDMPNASVSLISMLMVLHHIHSDTLPHVFAELRRLIAPAGFILVREHDSPNEMVDALINIEHGVFEVALEKLTTGPKFVTNYFGSYRTRREWRRLFEQYGFVHLGDTKHHGPTRGYYSLFQSRDLPVAPIDAKDTPGLLKELLNNGSAPAVIASLRNDADIKKMIVGGRRELFALEDALLDVHP